MRIVRYGLVAALIAISSGNAHAAYIGYTDQTAFLNDLAALGTIAHEGFEGNAWDGVRSSITSGFVTAPNISNNGVTWSSNFPAGGITTSGGPARTGNWGFYAYPHGSFDLANTACSEPISIPGVCGDGFQGEADSGVLYGVGGWIDTNTPFAKLGMFVGAYDPANYSPLTDDFSNEVDFGETCDGSGENCSDNAIIGTQSKFFGVIDTTGTGFTQFEFRELEGTNGDQKFIFSDDFYYAGSHISAVPIPAAVWLFAPGLLGLVGLSRRGKVA